MSLSRPSNAAIAPHDATIVVIEDDVLLSDLLRMAIGIRIKPADLRLFRHGQPAIEHCRAAKPNLVIVDLGLPDMDGRKVIAALQASSPGTRLIVLTGQVGGSLAAELLTLGVAGYVDKGSSLEHAEAAIRRVLDGGMFFSTGTGPATRRVAGATASPPPDILTEREREIVRLVAKGLVSKEIAAELKLSPRTIEKARARISQKLHVRDLPSLIKWSVEHGLT